jgi:2-iminobutanoate/2-iminopropanoate deaminase
MRVIIALVMVAAAGCATNPNTIEYIARPNAPGPFSEAVRVGNIVFLSGELGTDSTGRLVPGGIGAETRQTLENIKGKLARLGLTMDNVVKCTAMLADINEWGAMNAVYRTYFPGPKPARSAFGTSGLVRGARMELECIAAVP